MDNSQFEKDLSNNMMLLSLGSKFMKKLCIIFSQLAPNEGDLINPETERDLSTEEYKMQPLGLSHLFTKPNDPELLSPSRPSILNPSMNLHPILCAPLLAAAPCPASRRPRSDRLQHLVMHPTLAWWGCCRSSSCLPHTFSSLSLSPFSIHYFKFLLLAFSPDAMWEYYKTAQSRTSI